ncbi:hypothetical protein [Nocardia sp. IFM 10818]
MTVPIKSLPKTRGTAAVGRARQHRPSAPPESWVRDLNWHRTVVYPSSKFQWQPSDAALVATKFTGGQDEFTTVADLTVLTQKRKNLTDYTATCERALGRALSQSQRGLGCRTADLAEILDMTPLEVERAVYSYSVAVTWSDKIGDRSSYTNRQVRRITEMCDGLLISSPLLLAWELKQLWSMYRAAENLLEDTFVDLVLELKGTADPAVIVYAAGAPHREALHGWIRHQRALRGEPGDPRRIPSQY